MHRSFRDSSVSWTMRGFRRPRLTLSCVLSRQAVRRLGYRRAPGDHQRGCQPDGRAAGADGLAGAVAKTARTAARRSGADRCRAGSGEGRASKPAAPGWSLPTTNLTPEQQAMIAEALSMLTKATRNWRNSNKGYRTLVNSNNSSHRSRHGAAGQAANKPANNNAVRKNAAIGRGAQIPDPLSPPGGFAIYLPAHRHAFGAGGAAPGARA